MAAILLPRLHHGKEKKRERRGERDEEGVKERFKPPGIPYFRLSLRFIQEKEKGKKKGGKGKGEKKKNKGSEKSEVAWDTLDLTAEYLLEGEEEKKRKAKRMDGKKDIAKILLDPLLLIPSKKRKRKRGEEKRERKTKGKEKGTGLMFLIPVWSILNF